MDQEKKEKLRRMRGSLAARILLIATVFLIIPLLILVCLLYMDDLRVKKENNLFTLNVILDQKVALIEGVAMQEMEVLFEISYLLPKVANPESTLAEVAKRDSITDVFHVRKTSSGKYIVDMSSNEELKGKDFTHLIEEAAKGTVFVVDPKTSLFYLTHYERETGEGWISIFTPTHLKQNFPIARELIPDAATSLLGPLKQVILSTNNTLVGKTWHLSEKETIATLKEVPKTNFFLIISAPKAINFVDIPYFFLKISVGLVLIGVVGGGGALLLTKKLSKPLRKLTTMMGYVARGDLKKRYTPSPMGFEINALGDIFNETIDSLSEHMEVAHAERLQKETYENELLLGEEVQASILPKTLPKFPGVEMAARFISAKEVGGDFYDFLPNKKLMISIADTSGKGISACLYSLSIRSMLRSYGEFHQDLNVIVRKTNNLFCLDTGDSGIFVTAFIALFDPETKIFHYSNCGHFPALLKRANGAIESLTTKGMALGVIQFETVETNQVELQKGDTLLLFTDGLVEAHNSDLELFGMERLTALFENKNDHSPQEIVDDLIEEVALFAAGYPQHDDLTILVIKAT